jgi:hypothetical protein
MKTVMSVCAVLVMAACCVLPAAAQTGAVGEAAVPEGKIFNSSGRVECMRAGRKTWVKVVPPFILAQGDRVRTGSRSMAEIYMRYGAKVRLGAKTRFVINRISREKNSVTVLVGRLEAWIKKNASRRFEVRTPSAVCAVRGTTFAVEVGNDGETVWDLFKGALEVSGADNRPVVLSDNQRLTVTKEEDVKPVTEIPADVNPPAEPKKTAEERLEDKTYAIDAQASEEKAKDEAAAKAKAEAEAKAKAEAEVRAKAKAEAEVQAKAETEAKAEADVEATPKEPISAVNPSQEAEMAAAAKAKADEEAAAAKAKADEEEAKESEEVSGSTP